MNPGLPDTDAAAARLAHAYRESAREEPPAHLDAAILAAARREVGAGPRKVRASFTRRWAMPVSIAAVVVVSVSLVTLMREEGGDTFLEAPRPAPRTAQEAAKADAPAPADTASAVAKAPAAAPPPRATDDAARRNTTGAGSGTGTAPTAAGLLDQPAPRAFPAAPPPAETVLRKESATAERPASAPGMLAAPAPDARDRGPRTGSADVAQITEPDRQARSEQRGRDAGSEDALRRAAPMRAPEFAERESMAAASGETRQAAPAAKPAPAPARAQPPAAVAKSVLVRDLETLPPQRWLEKIAELRREGRAADADELLAEFRKRFPDHPIPPSAH